MKSFLPIFIRLLLVGGVAGIAYIYIVNPHNLPTPVQKIVDTSSLYLNNLLSSVDKNQVLTKAGEKLTQPQPIIQDNTSKLSQAVESDTSQVKGASTTQLSETAQSAVNTAVSQVSQQLQSLPKKEAAQLLRATCEQIASNLEK